MLDLVQPLATRGSLSVLSEGTARALEHLRCLGECGRRSRRDHGRERALRHRQYSVRAHVSSSGRRPPHAVRSAGVAYLPIGGFQEFHPVGRVSSCGWVALCERRRVGFARLSGWQPVGNWAASAGEFSSIPVTRRRYPDTSRRIATHGLRRKMARSQTEGMAVGHVFSSQEGQKPSPRWGSFFCPAPISCPVEARRPWMSASPRKQRSAIRGAIRRFVPEAVVSRCSK